jgi:hypothetical protein
MQLQLVVGARFKRRHGGQRFAFKEFEKRTACR